MQQYEEGRGVDEQLDVEGVEPHLLEVGAHSGHRVGAQYEGKYLVEPRARGYYRDDHGQDANGSDIDKVQCLTSEQRLLRRQLVVLNQLLIIALEHFGDVLDLQWITFVVYRIQINIIDINHVSH